MRIFGTLVKGCSRIFGAKFWKKLKKIHRNQSSKWGSLEASRGTQKPLKPLQKPLIWVVVKKF